MTTTTPTPALADLDNTAKEALRDLSHIENHLQESSAPTTVMNRALDVRMGIKELRAALARRAAQPVAPSPQIAEVVELPRYNIDAKGLPYEDSSGVWVAYSDAIAASRRAAGGEWNDALEAAAKLMDPYDEDGTVGAINAKQIRALKRVTPAPASAGQASTLAEPIYQKLLSAGVWSDEDKDEYDAREGGTWRIVSAQPAEGAGQVGQVACKNEKCEGGRHYNTEHTRSWPCPDCTAPTERAAAPAEQPSAQKGGEA